MCSERNNTTLLVLGFPIRISSDHSSVGSSPRLFAASYVLRRFLVPRHPPFALNNFDHKDARVHCVVLKVRAVLIRVDYLRKQSRDLACDMSPLKLRFPVPSGPNNVPLVLKDLKSMLHCFLSYLKLLRKEVIQPHLPVRLPCYDFVPITDPTLGSSLLAVGRLTLGVTDFRDVTGGVYKPRERIHRSVADLRLLATPTSWGRVADPNPN